MSPSAQLSQEDLQALHEIHKQLQASGDPRAIRIQAFLNNQMISAREAQQSPPDQGFVSTLWKDAQSLPQMALNPVGAGFQAAQQVVSQAKRAGQAISEARRQPSAGNISNAVGQTLGTFPVVGPMAVQAGEELGAGQYGQGSAHALEALAAGDSAVRGARGARIPSPIEARLAELNPPASPAPSVPSNIGPYLKGALRSGAKVSPRSLPGGAIGASIGYQAAGPKGALAGGLIGAAPEILRNMHEGGMNAVEAAQQARAGVRFQDPNPNPGGLPQKAPQAQATGGPNPNPMGVPPKAPTPSGPVRSGPNPTPQSASQIQAPQRYAMMRDQINAANGEAGNPLPSEAAPDVGSRLRDLSQKAETKGYQAPPAENPARPSAPKTPPSMGSRPLPAKARGYAEQLRDMLENPEQ